MNLDGCMWAGVEDCLRGGGVEFVSAAQEAMDGWLFGVGAELEWSGSQGEVSDVRGEDVSPSCGHRCVAWGGVQFGAKESGEM